MTSPGPSSTAGPLALVGSGEYLPQMVEIDRGLIAGRPPRFVQLATASVPDGPPVVDKWHRLGRQQAERLGVEAVVLDVRTREDAEDPAFADQAAGAGLIYLSGGNPGYLADTLRGTALWAAIVAAWRAGAALAGCSAGAMVLASRVPSLRHPREGGTDGLALLPHLRVIPHFDAFASRMPDFLTRFLVPTDPSVTVLGVDEDTALVGGPTNWTVQGRSSVWRLSGEGREELPAGTTVTTLAALS
ncbi:MAG: Type 1 glutamine amidotransferase-like domain-containing protein [Acidimicrobiales bacterium]